MKTEGAASAMAWVLLGIAFMLLPGNSAHAASQFRVLHSFYNQPAASPEGPLLADAAGSLYGTAAFGNADICGSAGCGTVFKLTREAGGKWSYSNIHRFRGADGERPVGGLTFDSAGNLYGTTYLGGAQHLGTVFELSPVGSRWKETVLYSFGTGASLDLAGPQSGAIFDSEGNLYGTTTYGGPNLQGGVFELQHSDSGWKEKVLHAFTGGSDGGGSYIGRPVWDATGHLYTTAYSGGEFGYGVVLKLARDANGGWTETVLYNFTNGEDGGYPAGGVIFDSAGNLYGATDFGGLTPCDGKLGCGTVYQLTPFMGTWKFKVLHAFKTSEGQLATGLIFDAAGNLYGAMSSGGGNNWGTVFKLSPSGNGWTATVLEQFSLIDGGGASPYGGLVLNRGVLYGTNAYGGVRTGTDLIGYGTVFAITP